ncbi:MAG: AI-2E family transporter [Planctomycetota bacterium]
MTAPSPPPKPETPPARPVWQRRWFQVLLAVLVGFGVLSYVVPGVLGALYAVRSVLVPVLVGLALAYIVNPVLRLAERRLKIGRLAGTICLMLLSLVAAAAVLPPAIGLTWSQGESLVKTVREAYPRYLEQLLDQLDPPSESPPEAAGDGATVESEPDTAEAPAGTDTAPTAADEPGAITDAVKPLVDPFTDPATTRRWVELSVERLRELDGAMVVNWAWQSLDVGAGLVGSAVSLTTYLALSAVVVAFCFFFFSWKFDAILAWFVPFIPASHRDETLDVVRKMDGAVSAFVRGRVVQSVVMMAVLIVGWLIADVPYWFLLGVATGLMNLVPFLPALGWIVAVALTVMSALAGGEAFTIWLVLGPSIAYFVAQLLDGWLIEPVVQGQATNLDPLTVLLVVLVGGTLAGLLGMLLAIPLAACVKIASKELLLPRLRALAKET